MKILRFTSNLLALGILALGFSSMANAQATRTWVSGLGDDANPCSRTAPCKTFAGAISKTMASGEIECLDPGGFGALTITKAITVDCDAGPGGVLVSGTNGIVINAGPTDVVTLRSINFNGLNTGLSGVLINSAKMVHLLDLNIYEFTTAGVQVSASANVFVTIKDTQIHECPNGIQISASSGLAVVDVDHVSIYNSTNGINGQTGSHFVVHNSTFLQDTVAVNQTASGSGGTVVGSTFSFNTTAFQSISGAILGVSGNTISGSSPVFNANGGTLSSGGDNVNFANGALGTAAGGQLTKI